MISYAAFGLRLDSDFELPELDEARPVGAPTWRVAAGQAGYRFGTATLLGADSVYGEIQVRAYSSADVLRLVFDDTGTFEIHRRERTISWHRGPSSTDEAMRADLLGRVIAFAAHGDGAIALHASAVCIDGRAIALLGPKGSGKSTLALALVRRGARLITDDTLIVRFDGRGVPWAAPGVQRVRLWEDSARALGARATHGAGAKPTIGALTAAQRQCEAVPLEACYVIHPVPGAADAVVTRERLAAVRAAVACVGFSKLGSLAGGDEAVVTLDRCVRLARTVAVHLAAVQRDLDRLDEAAQGVLAWHRQRREPNAVRVG
jgi:hypothetical protein